MTTKVKRASAATLTLLSLLALGGTAATYAQRQPLPVIKRSTQGTTPFDRPPLIVLTRVRDKRTIQVLDRRVDGLELPEGPIRVEQAYRMSLQIVRANERLASDPHLGGRAYFLLRQKSNAPVELEFGKRYILFIEFAKEIGGSSWHESDSEPPPYSIALPDAGFEVVGDKVDTATVRVLRRGGTLMPYDGKAFDDVFRLITGQSFQMFEPGK